MNTIQSRRDFLTSVSAATAASLLGAWAPLAEEDRPETTTIRLNRIPGICIAPQYIAEELLRAEGFTDVRYVPISSAIQHENIVAGQVDFSLHFAAPLVIPIDAGAPITVLAGVHPGCFELFARADVRTILDLKGRSVGIQAIGSSPHVFLTAIAAYVGLDPARDIDWVTSPSVKPMQLFAEGKIDAFLGLPPEPQLLRARNIGHVIVNSAQDRPWSEYFCCMLAGNSEFIQKHPIATKRVLRAILKAADVCATEPREAAQTFGRCRIYGAPRLRPRNPHRASVCHLARVRSRGHDAFLCAAPARGRHDQVHPEHDPRPRHQLALSQRAEARAEGMSRLQSGTN
jgi:NitT/TauT family transport system substrate-binding protein